MSRPPGRRSGLVPLAAAVASTTTSAVWLVANGGELAPSGLLPGMFACLAAAYLCGRISSQIIVSRAVRGFWKRHGHASFCLFLSSMLVVVAYGYHKMVLAPYLFAGLVLAVVMSMLGFLHLPLGDRSMLTLIRMVLDGLTVAVAGGLVFFAVVGEYTAAGVAPATRIGMSLVGVGGLIALVVIGRAAAAPAGPVDAGALRFLTIAPLFGVVTAVFEIMGDEYARNVLAVLALPVVATAICVAAYRQIWVLDRPAPAPAPVPVAETSRRSMFNLMPFLAVASTAGLLVVLSAREMTWPQRLVVIGAVLIACFVVLRQLTGVYEHRRALRGIRRQQAELEHLALHDPLTGLANRARFGTVLAERLDAHLPAAVLLIDVDDFKMVNDTMGHALGDQLLYEVAQRLRHGSRAETDLPARLGGDEFAVLLSADDAEYAEQAAARILDLLSAPFAVGEHQLLAQASIGVALAGAGDSADEVLRNADIAMYAAKDAGKAEWARFEPRMRADVVNHARLGSELHNAIIRHELFLLYQPVFDLVTGRMSGAEALVRWRHPERGFVPPIDFIPVAERSGLIIALGRFVLREACAQLARWHSELGPAAIRSINVNVAARQLRDAGFVGEVAAALRDFGLQPGNLVLEVTESSVLDGRRVRESLEALHAMGVRLALDDFGTGQSSLSLLRAFPVDVLKLDKSFVDGISEGSDRGRLAVAAAVAQLAEYLQLSAVAEGIETEAQAARLREMGYRLGQGFHLARPLPPAEAAALMVATAPVLN
ncbi:putative bifunctional diguanylate cyclase/phosphodiesterase [Actinoplanes sp. NPDC049265]|uniref:putative bifunctional diguanylate cyclase/phosphodiesterase n=1 Tax=Actinoplanes sp. NPDC049265 TaxID=3363902 RepID=UPI0037197082